MCVHRVGGCVLRVWYSNSEYGCVCGCVHVYVGVYIGVYMGGACVCSVGYFVCPIHT